MAIIKSFFPVPYISACFVALLHSIVGLSQHGFSSAWLGAFVGVLPAAIYFARLMARQWARTPRYLPSMIVGGALGTILALMLSDAGSVLPLVYAAVVGLVGSVLYVFWYSPYPVTRQPDLAVGQILPDFSLPDHEGRSVTAEQIRAAPALILFFRGNWCPLCMTQISEVAAHYRELHARGVHVFLISPQDGAHSRDLAARFDVPFRFLVDDGSRLAERLGLFHKHGVPKGMLGYGADTVVPTVVATAAGGRILFAEVADNYRVRPEPDAFLRIFEHAGVAA